MSCHVFVVEDDRDTREVLAEVLAIEGYQVTTATNGQEALELLHSHAVRPSVIVLDMLMPVMSGAELLGHLAHDPELSEVPVIALSGLEPEHCPTEHLLASFIKPVRLQDLLETISTVAPPAACASPP